MRRTFSHPLLRVLIFVFSSSPPCIRLLSFKKKCPTMSNMMSDRSQCSSPIKAVMVGFGAVHQHLCKILIKKPGLRFGGRALLIVGVSDSKGGVYCAKGFDPALLLENKQLHGTVTQVKLDNAPVLQYKNSTALCTECPGYDVLLEASPVDLRMGEPGLSCAQAALSLSQPAHIVFANKGPLVLQYSALHSMASKANVQILNSATVCGGLPVLNVATRDLYGAHVESFQGIFNSTTSYILDRMLAGESKEEALLEAQRRGIAEADPSLDIDGFDTANKLVLIANSMGLQANTDSNVVRLQDVSVSGIGAITREDMVKAMEAGNRTQVNGTADSFDLALVASAMLKPANNDLSSTPLYTFTVQPISIPISSFLGSFQSCDMGIEFVTDIFETIQMKTNELGVFPTAAAMLRDINTIYSRA